MNASSSKRVSAFLAGTLTILIAPMAAASGSGGSTHSTSMPSQSMSNFDAAAEFRKGVDALKESKYDDAEHSFARVLESSPRDANTQFYMGLAQGGQGKLADARGHFEKAVKYNDGLVFAHMELGVTLAKLGETDKAKAKLDDLKKRAAACGDSCAQASELKKAVSTLETELTPAAPPAAPSSPASPASPPTTQAVPAERELLDASIASGDGAYLHAVALINDKRYEDAIVALNDSSRVFGPHPDILTYLGYANRKLGRLDVAEDYYKRALAAAPNHLGATEYYGELMVVRGDLAGARRMLSKLEDTCHFGCAQADELRRWVVAGKPPSS
jgi:tetratricopeptide (TPR) repeat protein